LAIEQRPLFRRVGDHQKITAAIALGYLAVKLQRLVMFQHQRIRRGIKTEVTYLKGCGNADQYQQHQPDLRMIQYPTLVQAKQTMRQHRVLRAQNMAASSRAKRSLKRRIRPAAGQASRVIKPSDHSSW